MRTEPGGLGGLGAARDDRPAARASHWQGACTSLLRAVSETSPETSPAHVRLPVHIPGAADRASQLGYQA